MLGGGGAVSQFREDIAEDDGCTGTLWVELTPSGRMLQVHVS